MFNLILGAAFTTLVQNEKVPDSKSPGGEYHVLNCWKEPTERMAFKLDTSDMREARAKAEQLAAENGMEVHILMRDCS